MSYEMTQKVFNLFYQQQQNVTVSFDSTTLVACKQPFGVPTRLLTSVQIVFLFNKINKWE